MNSEKNILSYFELTPIAHPSQADPRATITRSIADAQLHPLDADFEHGGTWAGVTRLIEIIYLDLLKLGRTEVVEKHNYELHMVLAGYRDRLPLKYGSLTDVSRGMEKTRNFPLDRAYRIAHGLIELVMEWRSIAGAEPPCILLVENFSRAQHLARRFFLDLARRASHRANLAVIVACQSPEFEFKTGESFLSAVPVSIPSSFGGLSAGITNPIISHQEAGKCLETLFTFEGVELNYPRVLAWYKSAGDSFGYARAALAALHACNHFGYYYEASTFVQPVLQHFDRLTDGNEENRWNYAGNLYHSLVVQGAVEEARHIIEHVAKPFLTQTALLAKVEYVLGIMDLRHQTPPNMAGAEFHLTSAVDLIRSAQADLDPHEYVFLKVFIENGLAFLRARQGRRQEAIQLCQDGYDLLTRELGADKHKLHRSVLQYNTAQVYAMMGELETALRYYDYAIQMDPNYSEYYNEVGNIYQRQGRFEEALNAYDMAVKLSAPYPEVHFNRAICLARGGQWQAALESCNYTLELKPDQPDAFVLRAEICEQLGKPDEALTSYDGAIELSGNLVTARVNKAVLLFNKGLFDPALAEMNFVISIENAESAHYENRAAIYKEMGKWDLCKQDEQTAELLRNRSGMQVAQAAS